MICKVCGISELACDCRQWSPAMRETLQAKVLRERMEHDAAGACCVCGLTLTAKADGTPYVGVACIVTDNDGVKHFECWQGRESARGPILELTATEVEGDR